MKKRVHFTAGAAFTLFFYVVVVIVTGGCESVTPEEREVKVSPRYASIAKGGTIELTATGWSAYKWSLSKKEIGYLTATTGSKVTYVATKGGENIQTVTVIPVGGGDVTVSTGGSETNASSMTVVSTGVTPGEATIEHR